MFNTLYLFLILIASITNSLFAQNDNVAIGKDGEKIIDQAQYDIAKKFTEYVLGKDKYNDLKLSDQGKIWLLIGDDGKLIGDIAPALFKRLKEAKEKTIIGPDNGITEAIQKLTNLINDIVGETKIGLLNRAKLSKVKKDLEDIRDNAIQKVRRLSAVDDSRPVESKQSKASDGMSPDAQLSVESLNQEVEKLKNDAVRNQQTIKNLQNANQRLKESIKQLSDNSSIDLPTRWIDRVSLILILILVSLSAIRLFLIQKQRKNRVVNSNSGLSNPPISDTMKENTSKILDKLNTIEQKVENNQKKISSAISAINKPPSQFNPPSIPSSPNLRSISNSKFYARFPNQDGIFLETTESIENKTLYEFTLNKDTATFKFINERSLVQSIISRTHIYIKPACQENNNWNENATQIITLKPGRVQRIQGSKWKVTQKALVEYKS